VVKVPGGSFGSLEVDPIWFLTESRIRLILAAMAKGADILQRHGIQITAQRLAVLRAVSEHPHCTADDVTDFVQSEIGAISRQAVYDALKLLSERGIVRRIQPAGSPARYEDRVGDNHHHLICRTCGKTVDVACAVGHAPCLDPAEHHGFEINEAEVIYWGTCGDCRHAPASARIQSD
jgi:Fur family ferric uptake transcriptional regulator